MQLELHQRLSTPYQAQPEHSKRSKHLARGQMPAGKLEMNGQASRDPAVVTYIMTDEPTKDEVLASSYL